MRAADTDRIQVAQLLTDAAAQGQLQLSEYEDRLTRAYAAQTYDELDRLSADLPGASSRGRSGGPCRPAPYAAARDHERLRAPRPLERPEADDDLCPFLYPPGRVEQDSVGTRNKLQAFCDEAGANLRSEGRRFHEEALATLRKGPKTGVHTLTPPERAQWDALAVELGPRVRGKLVPAPMYDEVQKLLNEFRAAKERQ